MGQPSHRLKVRRAIEHRAMLDAAISRWADPQSCAISHDCEIKTRHQRLRAWVFAHPSDPLIPLLIGDCVHNIRQGLDQLAYSLAVAVNKADPPPNEETAEFPIMTRDRHQFDSELIKKIGSKKRMDPELYAALEGLQPYNGGDRVLLAILNELDRLDKHRFPPIVAGVAQIRAVQFETFQGYIGPIRIGAFEDGAEILEFLPDPGTKFDMQAHFAMSVALDKRSPVAAGQLVIPLLNQITAFIWNTVFESLEGFAA